MIGSFFAGAGLKILAGLALVGLVAGVLLGVRNAGRNLERVEQMKRSLDNARERRKIESRIDRLNGDDLDRLLLNPADRH